MTIKIDPIKLEQLSSELREFEERYGMSSEQFVSSFTEARNFEEEEDFTNWAMTYDAWKLASAAPRE